MNALEKLQKKSNGSKFICVGLDPDLNKIPRHFKNLPNPILEFNKEIVSETYKEAAAYKINFAFYEKHGAKGFEILKETIEIIPDDILIIGDAKRGDIENTASMYAESIFDYFNCDAATINPYMGEDSVKPFLERIDKLNFFLAFTSNKGAEDFEKLKLDDGRFLFQKIIEKVNIWNDKKNCGVVFGATKIEELRENISSLNELPVLLPGVGAQGADLQSIVSTFKENNKIDFLINVSRGIIYKSSGKDFAKAAGEELNNLNKKIKSILI
jgi:orotidine-5'-phosphate decarboxylase